MYYHNSNTKPSPPVTTQAGRINTENIWNTAKTENILDKIDYPADIISIKRSSSSIVLSCPAKDYSVISSNPSLNIVTDLLAWLNYFCRNLVQMRAITTFNMK